MIKPRILGLVATAKTICMYTICLYAANEYLIFVAYTIYHGRWTPEAETARSEKVWCAFDMFCHSSIHLHQVARGCLGLSSQLPIYLVLRYITSSSWFYFIFNAKTYLALWVMCLYHLVTLASWYGMVSHHICELYFVIILSPTKNASFNCSTVKHLFDTSSLLIFFWRKKRRIPWHLQLTLHLVIDDIIRRAKLTSQTVFALIRSVLGC